MGIVLATKHITEAKKGLNPKAAIIPTGIATAVPNPATASKKPPNPHASIRTKILLSSLTLINIDLITSMAFV